MTEPVSIITAPAPAHIPKFGKSSRDYTRIGACRLAGRPRIVGNSDFNNFVSAPPRADYQFGGNPCALGMEGAAQFSWKELESTVHVTCSAAECGANDREK